MAWLFMLTPIGLRANEQRVVRTLLVCSQCHDQKSEGQAWRWERVGKAKAERDDEAMIYLLKPSPLIVAGLTLGVAIAKATLVAELTIKQFLAIPLTSTGGRPLSCDGYAPVSSLSRR